MKKPRLTAAAFVLFFILGMALIPVMVHGFIFLQQKETADGNAWLQSNAMCIVYVMWSVLAAGMSLSLMLMKREGAFSK